MVRLCFVCLGNICRSPTAEGVMQELLSREALTDCVAVDSAGTAAYHVGENADARSRKTAEARGVDLPSVARKFTAADFTAFDYILAMDSENYENILALANSQSDRENVHLFRSFDPLSPNGASVPDPYYGGESGFDDVFDICLAACEGLLEHLREAKLVRR